jgi:hypothetical protein
MPLLYNLRFDYGAVGEREPDLQMFEGPWFAPTQSASSVDEIVAIESVFLPVEIELSEMEGPPLPRI